MAEKEAVNLDTSNPQFAYLHSVKLADLLDHYDPEQLRGLPGDPEAKHRSFRPFFENLHDGKLIYHERFTVVAEIEKMDLSDTGFQCSARTVAIIKRFDHGVFDGAPEAWSFGNAWENCCLSADCRSLENPHINFTIWPEAELVRDAEALVQRGAEKLAEYMLLAGPRWRKWGERNLVSG